MAESNAKVAAVAAAKPETARTERTREPRQPGGPSQMFVERASASAGGRSPHTPPSSFSALLGGLSGSRSARTGLLLQLQRGYGNAYVSRIVSRQAQPAAAGGAELSEDIRAASVGGARLEAGVRERLERGLGADLSAVRVHTDGEADRLAHAVEAVAFTSGQEVFFREGAYQPGTGEGMRLLAHEAAHTLQQSDVPSAGGVTLSRPSDPSERAADRAAEGVVKGDAPQARGALDAARAEAGVIQRQPAATTPAPPAAPATRPGLEQEPEDVPLGVDFPEVELGDVAAIIPHVPRLESFLALVKGDIALWRDWQKTMEGEVPGGGASGEANTLSTELPNPLEETDPFALPPPGGKIRARTGGFDYRVQSHLMHGLAAEELALLRQMVTFRVSSGLSPSSILLARAFGMEGVGMMSHHYALQATAAVSGKAKVGIGVTLSVRDMNVLYWNELGMRYTKPVQTKSGGILIGPGIASSIDLDVSQMSGVAAPTIYFWRPSDFETRFAIVKAGASAGANVGPVGGGREYGLVQAFVFMKGDHELWFDTGSFSYSYSPISVTKMPKKPIGGGAGAGTEMQYGYASEHGETEVVPPDIERRKTGQWIVLTNTSVFFVTGRAELLDESMREITSLVQDVKEWNQSRPQVDLRFSVLGHASPRWLHPKLGKTPEELNQGLSLARANAVAELVRGAFQAVGPGVSEFITRSEQPPDNQTLPDPIHEGGVQAEGSKSALESGADPKSDLWTHRRVDILVQFSEVGVVVNPPAYRPPEAKP